MPCVSPKPTKFSDYVYSAQDPRLSAIVFKKEYLDNTPKQPNKESLVPFAAENCIPVPEPLWQGDIHNVPGRLLSYDFCLKPINGCTSRGVFLMHKGVNLKTGRKYSSMEQLRSDYLLQARVPPFFKKDCIVEELMLNKERVPDDYKVYVIGGVPFCILAITDRFKRNGNFSFKILDRDWSMLEESAPSEPNLPSAGHREDISNISGRIAGITNIPFLRIDFLIDDNKGVVVGEINRWSGPNTGVKLLSFSKFSICDELDGYLGCGLMKEMGDPVYKGRYNKLLDYFSPIVVKKELHAGKG